MHFWEFIKQSTKDISSDEVNKNNDEEELVEERQEQNEDSDSLSMPNASSSDVDIPKNNLSSEEDLDLKEEEGKSDDSSFQESANEELPTDDHQDSEKIEDQTSVDKYAEEEKLGEEQQEQNEDGDSLSMPNESSSDVDIPKNSLSSEEDLDLKEEEGKSDDSSLKESVNEELPNVDYQDSEKIEDQTSVDKYDEEELGEEQSEESDNISLSNGKSSDIDQTSEKKVSGEENSDAKDEEIKSDDSSFQESINEELPTYDHNDSKKIEDQTSIDEYDEEELEEDQETEEEKETEEKQLPPQSNEFLNKLNELPSFKNRQREDGYAIDINGNTELPDSIIRTLITKFLNQRFCKRESDLNHRSSSLEKSKGFYKWEVKDVIVHYKTHQVTKVLSDKYAYDYEQGHSENVPLSFYFDMSGSMSNYTNMLATIAIELLKKDVKVLIGFNEQVNVQIESIDGNIEVNELAKILNSAGYSNYWHQDRKFIKDSRIRYKFVEEDIDTYLIDKKCEKCVVFSDFDPRNEIIHLSQKAQVYWFCFERGFTSIDLGNFNGFIYQVNDALDILDGLVKVNEKRFETLCYVDNDKVLKRSNGKK